MANEIDITARFGETEVVMARVTLTTAAPGAADYAKALVQAYQSAKEELPRHFLAQENVV